MRSARFQIPTTAHAPQVGALLAYGLFWGLYGYAEWLQYQRRRARAHLPALPAAVLARLPAKTAPRSLHRADRRPADLPRRSACTRLPRSPRGPRSAARLRQLPDCGARARARSRRSYKGVYNSDEDVEEANAKATNGKAPNGAAAAPGSPTHGGVGSPTAQPRFSYLGCGFARCAAPGGRPSCCGRAGRAALLRVAAPDQPVFFEPSGAFGVLSGPMPLGSVGASSTDPISDVVTKALQLPGGRFLTLFTRGASSPCKACAAMHKERIARRARARRADASGRRPAGACCWMSPPCWMRA